MAPTTINSVPALPTLYHQGKVGGIYSWRVWTEGADIITEYGLVDGEKQIARKTAAPKNIGRANETTAEEQADLEAQAMWQKKRDRQYAESVEDAQTELIRPMLASDFEKRKTRNVTYPAFAQPKLDGVRALAFWNGDQIEIMSRSGKSWRDIGSIEHIATALQNILPRDSPFDGEINAHDEIFQLIRSAYMPEKSSLHADGIRTHSLVVRCDIELQPKGPMSQPCSRFPGYLLPMLGSQSASSSIQFAV